MRLRLDYDRPIQLSAICECLELAMQAPRGGDAAGSRQLSAVYGSVCRVAYTRGTAFRAATRKPDRNGAVLHWWRNPLACNERSIADLTGGRT